MSNSQMVREFSSLVAKSQGKELPNKAIPFSTESAKFMAKMVIDELIEMLAYSSVNVYDRKKLLSNIIENADYREDLVFSTPSVEGQMDSVVDIEYYMKDVCARHGQNTDKVFELVHKANMAKVNDNGLFTIREDGKVVKPQNWKPADITTEVERQMKGSSFDA